jgi:hypothetical protein
VLPTEEQLDEEEFDDRYAYRSGSWMR